MGHEAEASSSGWRALDDLVTDVINTRRQIATLQAQEALHLAAAIELVAERVDERRRTGKRVIDRDLPLREVSAELAAAMRLSDRTVQGRMSDAFSLCSRLPATLRAWRSGAIDAGHVAAILSTGTMIADDDLRAQYEQRMLDSAAHESPARLRPLAHAVAAQLDPDATAERRRHAIAERGARAYELGDGIGRLQLDTDLVLIRAIEDRLTQMAKELSAENASDADAIVWAAARSAAGAAASADAGLTGEGLSAPDHVVVLTGPRGASGGASHGASDGGPNAPASDTRTIDQLRADIMADLLLAGAPAAHGDGDALGAIRGHVQVTIPVLTLAGIDAQPALLAGHGPIDTETARRLAATAPGWDRIMTHPFTGEPLGCDRYRPDAALVRFLSARDERCRFPGCRRPPRRCDIDHTIDAALGGTTSTGNLAHLCRRHHTLKHATAWIVRQLGGGVLEWTSPTGRRYLDRPPATVRFVPDDRYAAASRDGDPPPF